MGPNSSLIFEDGGDYVSVINSNPLNNSLPVQEYGYDTPSIEKPYLARNMYDHTGSLIENKFVALT